MKRCPECNAIFEDSIDVCPTCGVQLEPFASNSRQSGACGQSGEKTYYSQYDTRDQHETGTKSAIPFEQNTGNRLIINGSVAESNTQQYYQSKFTKIVNAIFSGEPYQFSHTTFVTVFRVEEHATRGFPEQARDITVYGNMQNLFAVGDDVTVEAVLRGERCIAKKIYNHSINSNVHVQPYISASVIRFTIIAVLALIIGTVYSIATADYAAIGQSITSRLSALLPMVAVIGGAIFCLKCIIKPK